MIFSDGDIVKVCVILEEVGWKINCVGVCEKVGKEVCLILWYVSGDSIWWDLVEVVCVML